MVYKGMDYIEAGRVPHIDFLLKLYLKVIRWWSLIEILKQAEGVV